MRNVAAVLGVSAAALYHHFAGKHQLLEHVADRAFADFGARLKDVQLADPAVTIRRILGEYRSFAREEPALFNLIFIQPRPTARKFPRDFAEHRSAVFNVLWAAVEGCLSREAEDDDALYLAHDLWALAHGHILLAQAGRFETEEIFTEVFDQSIEHFIASLSRY
jgi:AcrR family transcriptional regulator